ncbi:hypothetical protein [Nocardia sp. CA-135398]|uniref:hypothetical protein n=1 Tax=Nocardia sp. CA-135398 TaxID=3239977 RepID=UPI003D9928A6
MSGSSKGSKAKAVKAQPMRQQQQQQPAVQADTEKTPWSAARDRASVTTRARPSTYQILNDTDSVVAVLAVKGGQAAMHQLFTLEPNQTSSVFTNSDIGDYLIVKRCNGTWISSDTGYAADWQGPPNDGNLTRVSAL